MACFASFLFTVAAAATVVHAQTCGGDVQVIDGQTSILQSPNHPADYPPNSRCSWTVSGPAGRGLYFSASVFQLEGSGSQCSYDWLEIAGEKYCGTSFPSGLAVSGSVTVEFRTDASVNYAGFKILISTGPPVTVSACGGQVVAKEGETSYVISPGYPRGYQNSQKCTYLISGPADKGLVFDTAFFATEARYDTLEFTEGVDGVVKSLGQFSGTNGPKKVRSATNQVNATFISDSSQTLQGFNVTVRIDNCPGKNVCPNNASICIAASEWCDGTEQCPGGVDEQYCKNECGRPVMQPSLSGTKDGKIVGGEEANAHSWPWQIAFLSSGGSQFCGGSLIDASWVLTAAHCCRSSSNSPTHKVLIGAHSLSANDASARTHTLKRMINHPGYGSSPVTKWDFCLLELNEPVQFSPERIPICLANSADGAPGTKCYTTGWGNIGRSRMNLLEYEALLEQDAAGKIPKDYANMLRGTQLLNQVDVNITTFDYCNNAYDGRIQPNMICASNPGKDSCQGDSGGPLVCQRANGEFGLVGVTSWGRGCASPGYPGVYGRVSEVLSWISETMYS